jgi:hypothetical protein
MTRGPAMTRRLGAKNLAENRTPCYTFPIRRIDAPPRDGEVEWQDFFLFESAVTP